MIKKFPKIKHLAQTDLTKEDLFKQAIEFSEKVDGIQFHFGRIDGEIFMKTKNSGPITKEMANIHYDWISNLGIDIFLKYFDSLKNVIKSGEQIMFEFVTDKIEMTIKYTNIPFLVLLFTERSNKRELIDELNAIFNPEIKVYDKHIYDKYKCLELLASCKSNKGEALENEFGEKARKTLKSAFGTPEIEGLVIKLINGDLIKVVPGSFAEMRTETWKERGELQNKRRKIRKEFFKTDLLSKRGTKLKQYALERDFQTIDDLINFFVKDVIEENKDKLTPETLDYINSELNSNFKSFEEAIKDLYMNQLIKIWTEIKFELRKS